MKLNDFNNKLYKIYKKSGVFEKLETKKADDLEEQKKVAAQPLVEHNT